MDVYNAFLYGDFDEEVYMKLPLGFAPKKPRMVCHTKGSVRIDVLVYVDDLLISGNDSAAFKTFEGPDSPYSINVLSQFMYEPRQEHWNAALGVVRYLKGYPSQGILLRFDSDLSLKGWCDFGLDWLSINSTFTYWLACLSGIISYFLKN
ncbi:uncharacterized mitochondrial protein AtMg00810-like [Gossypium hirsutum]|uniref:Uncharacterized mitochondrial protein AtMg00810-like n=1 Tax=Gossypium hirsutum TaxID=3635 RepID=A0A1U8LP59_GOSHI|nr:uncharacterized mitochondrial protein AtMg00810-like [Gossypium hirsutum]